MRLLLLFCTLDQLLLSYNQNDFFEKRFGRCWLRTVSPAIPLRLSAILP